LRVVAAEFVPVAGFTNKMASQPTFSEVARKEMANNQLQIKFFSKQEKIFAAKAQRSRRKANYFDDLNLRIKGFLGAPRVFAVQRFLTPACPG
jgi:hypothetical protein